MIKQYHARADIITHMYTTSGVLVERSAHLTTNGRVTWSFGGNVRGPQTTGQKSLGIIIRFWAILGVMIPDRYRRRVIDIQDKVRKIQFDNCQLQHKCFLVKVMIKER